jgi:hypothetical protein
MAWSLPLALGLGARLYAPGAFAQRSAPLLRGLSARLPTLARLARSPAVSRS